MNNHYQLLKIDPRFAGNLALLFLAAEKYHSGFGSEELKIKGGFRKQFCSELEDDLLRGRKQSLVVCEGNGKKVIPIGYSIITTSLTAPRSPAIEELWASGDNPLLLRKGLLIESTEQIVMANQRRASMMPEKVYLKTPKSEVPKVMGLYTSMNFKPAAREGNFCWQVTDISNIIPD